MAGGNGGGDGKGADPFERYFRPRPAGPRSSDDAPNTDGLGIPRIEDSQPQGVIIDGARAPHVPVSPSSRTSGGSAAASPSGRRSHRRRGNGSLGSADSRDPGIDGDGPDGPDGFDSPGGVGHGSGAGASAGGHRSPGGARRQRRSLMFTSTISALVLLSSGVGWAFQGYVLNKIEKIDPFEGITGRRPDSGPKGAMNILVAGVDRREGLKPEQIRRLRLGRFEGQRSDTMMLVHVSRDHDRVSVISLPRDSLVMIPSHKSNGSEGAKGIRVPARQGKLNWTYTYGGSTLMIDTIEKTTGIRIHHYVEVNFIGFIKMVDALGKVTVCTEQPVNDTKSGLRLPAGKSQLNGEQALAYARARYTLTGGSDLGRIDRQQQFLAALMQQALSTSTLTDPVKASRFLNASLEAVRVDRELADEAPELVKQMKGLSTDHVTFAKVPLMSQNHMVVLGGLEQSTVQWDIGSAYDLFRKINQDKPLIEPTPEPSAPAASPSAGGADQLTVAPGSINVRVSNGVGTRGLAATAAGDLQKAGFRTTVVPGVARTGLKVTQIQYGPGRADSAKTLAAAIPGARLKQVDSLGDVVQVIVGKDWKGAQKVTVKASPQPASTGGGSGSGSDQTGLAAKTATQQLCK